MKAVICDVCKQPIDPDMKFYQFVFGMVAEKGINARMDTQPIRDMCLVCFGSPILLSEMRRTRTRKPRAAKPKVGRPRGSKSNQTEPEAPKSTEASV